MKFWYSYSMKIKSSHDIDEFISTIYGRLPHLSQKNQSKIVRFFPVYIVFLGSYFVIIAVLPLIFPSYPYDPISRLPLFTINMWAIRLMYLVFGFSLLTLHSQLKNKEMRSWMSVFYFTLIYLLISLIFFDALKLVTVLITWYMLYTIKPLFSTAHSQHKN